MRDRDGPARRALLARACLYAITADAEPERIESVVAAWLRGGVQLVQLRHKTLPRGVLLALAERLALATAAAGALLIVNDHADIAVLSGADGVHLGPDDLPPAAARTVVGPDLLIGASAASPAAGVEAVAAGADYLGSGPAFSTPIKPEKRVIGPVGIASVAAAVRVPVFAIGGIDESRLAAIRAAGLTRACMIRALFEAPEPEQSARRALAALTP